MRSLISRTISAPFIENARPSWLFGLELDFFFDGIGLAIEFQGGQHLVPVHGMGQYYDQRRRDARKRAICKERGIVLLRLEAHDLIYSKFRGKIARFGFNQFLKRHCRDHGKELNRMAADYRVILRENFACPSAHKKGSLARKEAFRQAFGR